MKKIMILGAGIYQVPLILKAKELGLYTIVVSISGNYSGFMYADKVIYEDTVNAEAVLEIARKEKIDGICTTGTDVAMVTVGKVCKELGLKGPSEKGTEIACNKSLMKEMFQRFGVQTAQCRHIGIETSEKELKAVCEELGYPVIFKAIDSSGSRGITKVESPEEIIKAVTAIKEITKHEEYLVENYLVGEEFGAQGFVQDGKLEFVLPHGDFVYKGDTGVPIGHYAPYDLPQVEEEIYQEIALAVKAMQLDNCALNVDFILSNEKVYVLEIGARGGATCLMELVSLYYGYDYYEKILRVALGEKVDFTPVNQIKVPNASHLLMSDKDGIITEIRIECDTTVSWLKEIKIDYEKGDKVRKFRVGPDRIGHVIVVGDTLEEAIKRLEKTMKSITIVVEA